MIEIIGNFNTARVFATTLEDGAREQIKAVCDTEAFASSKIRICPMFTQARAVPSVRQ